MRLPRVLIRSAVSLLALSALLFAPAIHAADDSYDPVATTLLESGREALSKRRYDEAIQFFDKVVEEDASVIEALYWKAQALEKLARPHDALTAYRSFVTLYKIQKGDGDASATETSLAAKAEVREEKLGKGERELARLNEVFAKRLVAFASQVSEDDPALARVALQQALDADPHSTEALELLGTVGGADDADDGEAPAGPFAPLVTGEWHDLLDRKSIGGKSNYADGRLTLDYSGGKIVEPSERVRLAENYVFESDFRVLEEHSRGWLAGLVIGWGSGEFYSAFFQQGQVVLTRGQSSGGQPEDIDQHPLPPLKSNRWSRIGIRVRGTVLQVWFDGKLVITHEVDSASTLQGEVALFQQRCKVEYRLIRAGITE